MDQNGSRTQNGKATTKSTRTTADLFSLVTSPFPKRGGPEAKHERAKDDDVVRDGAEVLDRSSPQKFPALNFDRTKPPLERTRRKAQVLP